MKKFTQNIQSAYGEKGRAWLAELPLLVEKLAGYWQLKNLILIKNMSYNYVVKALASNDQPVVLKIGCDSHAIAEEKEALVSKS